MTKKMDLIQHGYLTQRQFADIVGITSASVTKFISSNRVITERVQYWDAPVISIREAHRVALSRGITNEDFTKRLETISKQAKWGPMLTTGVFATLGLLALWITKNKD